MQRRLCAPRELTSGEFEIAGEIFPVRHLSGDFFKVVDQSPDLALVLGDIAGKGLTAGIWQAHLMSLIHRAGTGERNPAEAVAQVNHELCQEGSDAPLTALFYAKIDSRTNELVYCNAGLPPPLLLRKNGTFERLENGGPMLGAVKDGLFQTGSVTLNEGDMLVAYSDGVTECRNGQDEEFEMERLMAAIRRVAGANASKALFSLLAAVLDFAESCSQNDDVTVLVVRRKAVIGQQCVSQVEDVRGSSRQPGSGRRQKRFDREGSSSKYVKTVLHPASRCWRPVSVRWSCAETRSKRV